jgi:hypothetical protein
MLFERAVRLSREEGKRVSRVAIRRDRAANGIFRERVTLSTGITDEVRSTFRYTRLGGWRGASCEDRWASHRPQAGTAGPSG